MKIINQVIAIGLVTFSLAAESKEKRLKSGDRFPMPQLKTISKKSYDKNDLKNSVVVYDVGGSWAHGAAEALPYYLTLLKKYKKRGLRVVAINIDNEKETALKHIEGVTNEFAVLHDEGMKFVKKLNPEGFPMVYVANRKGIIKDVIRDYCENEFDLLEGRIVKVLDEK